MNSNLHYQAVASVNEWVEGKMLSVWFKQKTVVLLRNQGKIAAYENYCPHRGVPLSEGFLVNGEIHCRYHGWRFDCETGNNTFVPVKNAAVNCHLKKYFALEKYGLIWLSTEENAILPSLFDEKPMLFTQGTINAKLANALENFLEGSHTHYIHEGWIRSQKAKRQPINATLVPNAQGFKVYYEIEKAKGFITQILPKKYQNLSPVATYIYPNTTILEYFNFENVLIARFENIMSERERETQYIARIFLNVGFFSPILAQFAKAVFFKVISQDKEILETQANNLAIFPENNFFSDETDLVGKQIFAWLYHQEKILVESVNFIVYW
ncbi:MAG: Rieske 2Fe-2S domain-containing protein [Bacteroidia bacterium]